MNIKAVTLLRNVWYAVSSNFVTLTISTLTILIFPKFLGVNEYGLFQLYIFYCAYVGIFHLGFNDGIYLRYGGKNYKELNKKVFSDQYQILLISQIIFCVFLWIFAHMFVQNSDKNFVVKMVSISMVLVNLRVMLVYILQTTNNIRQSSIVMLSDRVSFLFGIIPLLTLNTGMYKGIIVIDLAAKLISLLVAIYFCKEIIFNKSFIGKTSIVEASKNINVGIKLMIANFSNILIVGNVRFGIEKVWAVSIFGKVSLTLSISNFLLVFINAVGIVIFPLLKKISKSELPRLFVTLRTLLSTFLIGIMLFFYPLSFLLLRWLPDYKLSITYMGLLFPIILFEGKMALLVNTYLKAIRKERIILLVNLLLVFVSWFITLIVVYKLENLTLSILSIVFLLGARSLISEYLLSKILEIKFWKSSIMEIFMVTLFITVNILYTDIIASIIYFVFYLLYIYIFITKIKESIYDLFKIFKL